MNTRLGVDDTGTEMGARLSLQAASSIYMKQKNNRQLRVTTVVPQGLML